MKHFPKLSVRTDTQKQIANKLNFLKQRPIEQFMEQKHQQQMKIKYKQLVSQMDSVERVYQSLQLKNQQLRFHGRAVTLRKAAAEGAGEEAAVSDREDGLLQQVQALQQEGDPALTVRLDFLKIGRQ